MDISFVETAANAAKSEGLFDTGKTFVVSTGNILLKSLCARYQGHGFIFDKKYINLTCKNYSKLQSDRA